MPKAWAMVEAPSANTLIVGAADFNVFPNVPPNVSDNSPLIDSRLSNIGEAESTARNTFWNPSDTPLLKSAIPVFDLPSILLTEPMPVDTMEPASTNACFVVSRSS